MNKKILPEIKKPQVKVNSFYTSKKGGKSHELMKNQKTKKRASERGASSPLPQKIFQN